MPTSAMSRFGPTPSRGAQMDSAVATGASEPADPTGGGPGKGRWVQGPNGRVWVPYEEGDAPGPTFQDSSNNTGGVKNPASGSVANPTQDARYGNPGGYQPPVPTPPPADPGAPALTAPNRGAITYTQDPAITNALQALGQQQAPAYGGAAHVRNTPGAAAPTIAASAPVGSVSAPGVNAGAAPSINPVIAKATTADAAQQQDLINLLKSAAGGGQDSAAAIQARQAAAQQEAAQMSLAASAGPAGRAAALRSAMQGVGNVEAATASNVEKANLDAQVAARSELANVLSGMRGQNITENQSAADAQNQARNLVASLQGAQNVAGIGAQATLGAAQTGANAQLKAAQLSADTSRANTQAQLQSAASLQKSSQDAAAAQQNAELQQQASQFAASLGMSEQQLQQSGLLGLLGIDTTRMGISQQGQVAQQQMGSNEYIAQLQAANQKAIADKAAATQLQLQQNQGGFWDTLTKIAGPIIGAAAML